MEEEPLEEVYCPYITANGGCNYMMTQEYFTEACCTADYLKCHHYCRRLGKLKTAIEWLQKKAVESALSAQDAAPIS